MNRAVIIVVGCLALLAGTLTFTLVHRSTPVAEKPLVEAAPEKKTVAEEKTAADVLLERTPEQPALADPRARAPKAAPASPAEPSPAAPATGSLHIDADVPGAQVFIDREFIGTAPVTAEGLKPGTHRLNVAAEGYDGIVDTIEVAPGERDLKVKFREVRLDLAIDVIHKHRLGSCKGRLVATPQGLRYETTEKDDAFTAPLTDLEVFQVDYLEKNLKVKPRKGKQYNFSDPQGNADHLFVFQRDVDKARERLKKGDVPAGK